MTVTEGRWSCPTCSATWVRDVQPQSKWSITIRTAQEANGKRCGKGKQ